MKEKALAHNREGTIDAKENIKKVFYSTDDKVHFITCLPVVQDTQKNTSLKSGLSGDIIRRAGFVCPFL